MSIRSIVNEYLKMNGKYENENLEFEPRVSGLQTLGSKIINIIKMYEN